MGSRGPTVTAATRGEAFWAKTDAAQGAAPQGLSLGKAFKPLLEIGAVADRPLRPARLPADSREPARTNSPTDNSPPSPGRRAAHSHAPGRANGGRLRLFHLRALQPQ